MNTVKQARNANLLFILVMLSAFTLVFSFAANVFAATAVLSWNAPTTYTDGTPITSLGGYHVYTGTTSGSYSQNVDVGNVTSYTVNSLNASTTYHFAVTAYDATGDVSGYSNQVSYTTPAATPSPTTYAITASAGSGGSITPSGSVAISQGLSQSFSIAPSSGYQIAAVTVDGTSVGAVSSYTFSNVTANHTIAATFAANATTSYTVTATAYANGSISPSGATTVASGGSKTYTITPASGYVVSVVKVDGVSVGAVTSYTFSDVTANHTIAVSFMASSTKSYTITATAYANGSISPSGTTTVASGGSKTYAITPASGYKVSAVKIDGVSISQVTSYTFSDVTANHTIAVSFELR